MSASGSTEKGDGIAMSNYKFAVNAWNNNDKLLRRNASSRGGVSLLPHTLVVSCTQYTLESYKQAGM